MTTPEWLRPVSERFVGGDPGPPPWTVRVAAVLAATGAFAGAGMVLIWGSMVLDGVYVFVSVLLAATGLGLTAVLAASTVQLSRSGWIRQPVAAGLVLGVLALVGFLSYAPALAAEGYLPETYQTAAHVTPRLGGAALVGFGLALLLRSDSARDWLARRRYQVRSGPSS